MSIRVAVRQPDLEKFKQTNSRFSFIDKSGYFCELLLYLINSIGKSRFLRCYGQDRMIKEKSRVKYYTRYINAGILVHNDKNLLIFYLDGIKKYLIEEKAFISWKYISFPKEFIKASGVIKTDTERKGGN